MPYLPFNIRHELDHREPENAAELNYVVGRLIDRYVRTKGLRYQTIADIKAAVLGAEQEFHDRFARPYEDDKVRETGEVFTNSMKEVQQRRSKPPSDDLTMERVALPYETERPGGERSGGPGPAPTGNSACHVHVVAQSGDRQCLDCGYYFRDEDTFVVNPRYKRGGSKLGCLSGGCR